jgi:hypothetical protein
MPGLFSSRRSRLALGLVVGLCAVALTAVRARVVAQPIAALPIVEQMHREGRASDGAVANARYHARRARLAYSRRWTLAGYAMQGLLGLGLGLTIASVRGRRGAV